MKGKLQLLKKQAGSSKAMSLIKTLGNKRGKHLKKKTAVQLGKYLDYIEVKLENLIRLSITY